LHFCWLLKGQIHRSFDSLRMTMQLAIGFTLVGSREFRSKSSVSFTKYVLWSAETRSHWEWQFQRVRMPTNWHAMRHAGDVSSLRRETDRVRNSSRHKAIVRAPIRIVVRLRSVARYIPHSAADRHVHYGRVPLETPLRRTQAEEQPGTTIYFVC